MRTALILACVLFALFSNPAMAAEPPGVPVGKKAPDFILNDQEGKKQQLSKLLEKGPVALVFHRSAQW